MGVSLARIPHRESTPGADRVMSVSLCSLGRPQYFDSAQHKLLSPDTPPESSVASLTPTALSAASQRPAARNAGSRIPSFRVGFAQRSSYPVRLRQTAKEATTEGVPEPAHHAPRAAVARDSRRARSWPRPLPAMPQASIMPPGELAHRQSSIVIPRPPCPPAPSRAEASL
jgi:hypothetical protein